MTSAILRIFILLAAFASIVLIVQFALGTLLSRRALSHAINKRLRLLQAGVEREDVAHIFRKDMRFYERTGGGPFEKFRVKLRRMVAIAGIGMDPAVLFGLCLAAFAGLSGLVLLLIWALHDHGLNFGSMQIVLFLSAALTLVLPWVIVSQRAAGRRRLMEEQFPVALDVFTRGLRAGHPISSAIQLVTEEMEDPIGSEFGLVADEVTYGAELTDALLALADRWDMSDIRMFVISLSVQSETGGNLAEILENLSSIIRGRASMYLKVRALSAEGRVSALVLTVIPILVVAILMLANPPYYLDVSTDPIFIFGFSGLILLYLVGVLIIRKLVDLKV